MSRLAEFSSWLFPSEPSNGHIGSITLNLWLSNISGLPLLGLKPESRSLKIFLVLYGVVMMIVCTSMYTILELVDLIQHFNDLAAATQNMAMSMTHVSGVVKIMNTFYRYSDIRRVIEQLQGAAKKYVVSKKQRKAFFRGEFENKIPLLIYGSACTSTAGLGIVLLIADPEGVAGKALLYHVWMPDWMPLAVKATYMGMCVLWFAVQIVSVDYLNVNLINQIRFQLKILNITFDDLIVDAVAEAKGRKLQQTSTMNDQNERIKSIIEHHNLLTRLREDVESIFRFPILMQFFTSLTISATTGFQATVSSNSTSGSIIIFFYLVCVFCQLFMYCYVGNDVTDQSLTLSTSGYNSSWYLFDHRFKKSLLIFLCNAQRPFQFTAGGFMSLSLPSFTGIMGRAYTYITVLQQFYNR